MKRIRDLLVLLLVCVCSVIVFVGCVGAPAGTPENPPPESTVEPSEPTEPNEPNEPNVPTVASEILIAYFSCTNTTKGVAQKIAANTGGTLYEIAPETPYTADDLKYYTDCRADREQSDPKCRPAISGRVADMDRYGAVFVGYPIWHGKAPKIVYTFMESYEFAGKTVVPFCTSGSSPVGSSASELAACAPDAEWKDGRRFAADASDDAIGQWLNELGIANEKEQTMDITVKGESGDVVYRLNDSRAAQELYARLPLTVTVQPYGNNEIIFYPEKLDTTGAPLAEGGAGVLAYYAPWGDVVMFYGAFAKNGGLFELGRAVFGSENIKHLSGAVSISACKKESV